MLSCSFPLPHPHIWILQNSIHSDRMQNSPDKVVGINIAELAILCAKLKGIKKQVCVGKSKYVSISEVHEAGEDG